MVRHESYNKTRILLRRLHAWTEKDIEGEESKRVLGGGLDTDASMFFPVLALVLDRLEESI